MLYFDCDSPDPEPLLRLLPDEAACRVVPSALLDLGTTEDPGGDLLHQVLSGVARRALSDRGLLPGPVDPPALTLPAASS